MTMADVIFVHCKKLDGEIHWTSYLLVPKQCTMNVAVTKFDVSSLSNRKLRILKVSFSMYFISNVFF